MNSRSGVEPRTEQEVLATAEEARDAIVGLGVADLAKLMLIARLFVRPPALRAVLEAEDLLHSAIAKTLDGTRKWNKHVSILKHLDRVMESDASHALTKTRRMRPLGEEELEIPDDVALSQDLAKEQLADVLPALAEDEQAFEVLRLKAEGYSASEVRAAIGLGEREYDTVGRRIRRLRERLMKGGE